jgi:CheY-like chemotaxis protein
MKEGAKRRGKATILLILYEHIARNMLVRKLSPKGYKLVTASIGLDGIRKFGKGKGKFDLVIVDVHLPGVSGLNVAKKIKEIDPSTPVMLIKEWDKELDTKELKASGVDFLLNKPLYLDTIVDLVENAIKLEAR